MKLVLNFLISPIKRQTIEALNLEIQILRLICSLLWLAVTISLTMTQIGLEMKILVFVLGTLTALDILLRSFRLVETRKSSKTISNSDQ
jgi:hypothetical protein